MAVLSWQGINTDVTIQLFFCSRTTKFGLILLRFDVWIRVFIFNVTEWHSTPCQAVGWNECSGK